MIVTGSQNFGLAQLYQIRGRIGRSTRQAYAYFLYNSDKIKGKAAERLQALQEAEALGSGFQIATRDMEIRGMGNILGKKQHGKVSLIGLTLYNELIQHELDNDECAVTKKGATAVEYGLMVALIAVVIIAAVSFIGTSTSEKYSMVGSTIGAAGAAQRSQVPFLMSKNAY